jgi:hypothetical protein
MSVVLKILALSFGLLFLLGFIVLVKKRFVKPFYSALWLLIGLFVVSITLFEGYYKKIATLMGIADASFIIIVGLVSFLLIYVLYLSIKISELSDRVQELISHTSILENKIRKSDKNEAN